MYSLPQNKSSYLVKFLDGWRGLAAMLVVFHHCSDAGLMNFGSISLQGIGGHGVAVFFVLSSYLLSRNLVLDKNSILSLESLKRFFYHRFMRVYPLYFMYLLLALASSTVLILLTSHERGLPFFLTINDFFNHIFLQKGYGVTWTIVVEFKYYALLPFVTAAFLFLSKKTILFTISLALVVMTLFVVLDLYKYATATNISIWPFLPVFLLGSSLGVTQASLELSNTQKRLIQPKLFPVLTLIWLLAILLLMMSMPFFGALTGLGVVMLFPNLYFNTAILFSVILITSLYGPPYIRTAFESKVMRYLGSISFSVYLVHTLTISIVEKVIGNMGAGWILVVILTIGISHLSYIWIERPSIRIGRQGIKSWLTEKKRAV